MRIRLKVYGKNASQAREIELSERTAITLGKAGSDIVLPESDPGCALNHAILLELSGNDVRVKDLESGAGTFVNGQPVHEQRIAPGDSIRIGFTTLHVIELETTEQLKGKPPPLPAENPVVLTGWPDNFRAVKGKKLEEFVNHLDEEQIKKSVRLRNIVKNRAKG